MAVNLGHTCKMEGIKKKLTTLKKQVEEAEEHALELEKEKKEHKTRATEVSRTVS